MSRRLIVLIPAAEGRERFGSEANKISRPLLGKTLLVRAIEIARGVSPNRIIVVGGGSPGVAGASAREAGAEFIALAAPRKGVSGVAAVRAALSGEKAGDLLILPADRPLLRPETLRELLTYHRRRRADLTLMSAAVSDPRGCARIRRGPDGSIRVIADAEAGPSDLTIPEVDASVYAARIVDILSVPASPRYRRAAGHLDVAAAFVPVFQAGGRVEAFMTPAPADIFRVGACADLARAGALLRDRINAALMESGVNLADPATAWIDEQSRIAPDVDIAPFVVIEGATT
ncbi:MAG: NTP transferase domain-containing protein, partial [Candidatus Aminicenantales bacterium]